MLINHIWASIIEICVEKWRTQSLKKFEIQMSRHEKRYRSEEMAPGRGLRPQDLCPGETLRRPLPMFTSPFQIHSERISPHYETEWDYYSLYNHVTNSDQFVR